MQPNESAVIALLLALPAIIALYAVRFRAPVRQVAGLFLWRAAAAQRPAPARRSSRAALLGRDLGVAACLILLAAGLEGAEAANAWPGPARAVLPFFVWAAAVALAALNWHRDQADRAESLTSDVDAKTGRAGPVGPNDAS